MEYDNSKVRRQDRLLCETEAIELLNKGEYGFLSMVSEDGNGYGVPLNYVFEGEHIYFHCAPEGRKTSPPHLNKKVSFCVVGKTEVIPAKFTTAYHSVIAEGTMVFTLSDEEKKHALMLLVEKYSPDFVAKGEKYANSSLTDTYVIRLNIESISGKCKRYVDK